MRRYYTRKKTVPARTSKHDASDRIKRIYTKRPKTRGGHYCGPYRKKSNADQSTKNRRWKSINLGSPRRRERNEKENESAGRKRPERGMERKELESSICRARKTRSNKSNWRENQLPGARLACRHLCLCIPHPVFGRVVVEPSTLDAGTWKFRVRDYILTRVNRDSLGFA